MAAYFSLFAYFAAGFALVPPQRSKTRVGLLFLFGCLLTALMIGLRYHVGGDWRAYQIMFNRLEFQPLDEALTRGDPGYQFLNWAAHQLELGIWSVNLVCGLIFMWGLARFARQQPDPWLALLTAVPYLVVVVAMGYTRQAAALGVLMAGLASVRNGASTFKFAAYVAAAALFHRTAVVLFPLVAFSTGRSPIVNFLIALSGVVLFYDYFLGDSMNSLLKNYIGSRYSSQGAAVRVGIDAVSALLFLVFHKKLGLDQTQMAVWRNFSLAALGFAVLLVALPSSTAVDRTALYLVPLQIIVFARLPIASRSPKSVGSLVVILSFALLVGWLNFADHAKYWVPYELYPIY